VPRSIRRLLANQYDGLVIHCQSDLDTNQVQLYDASATGPKPAANWRIATKQSRHCSD
jgi:hypothetical protein